MFKFKQGSHFSTPRKPKFFVSTVLASCSFDENSIYDIDVDQDDWNKLTGISFNPFKPYQNAIMVAWRWNKKINKFQVAPYINQNEKMIFPSDNEILTIDLNEEFEVFITYGTILIIRLSDDASVEKTVNIKTNCFTAFRIQPYFGGNRVAPKDISINFNFQKNN